MCIPVNTYWNIHVYALTQMSPHECPDGAAPLSMTTWIWIWLNIFVFLFYHPSFFIQPKIPANKAEISQEYLYNYVACK